MSSNNGFRLGPAVMVTAAFIGPGTVLTASRAGAEYGFILLWAILFSVLTAVVLQEMAARLGVVSGEGLAHAIRSGINNRLMRVAAIALILIAILFGNTAYQTGNLIGAAAGMEVLTNRPSQVWAAVIAGLAATIILIGRYSIIQWVLTVLVSLMGLIFVLAAVLCRPSFSQLATGFQFSIPDGAGWVVVGLIGTTVVPYNLFLHASAAAAQYDANGDKKIAVRHSFYDTLISIGIGGLITASLLTTAAITFSDGQELSSIKDIAKQLTPSLGAWAEKCFAIGLFSAGLTSSITAPIAAAYATAGCLGWEAKLSDARLKCTALVVVIVGLVFAVLLGSSPKETIIIAQATNGLLLPIIAVFLIYAMNRTELLGAFRNRILANVIGAFVVVVAGVLAARQFNSVWGKLAEMLANSQ